jgi:hypothetical protein
MWLFLRRLMMTIEKMGGQASGFDILETETQLK